MIFSEMDHRLSVIKRWSIVHTIQQQSVAEHCFNVERIAVRIAKEWLDFNDDLVLFEISQYALHHDDFEAVSGDVPSTVKRYFNGKLAEREHEDIIPIRSDPPSSIKNVVKLADRLEWYWFLTMESALGNKYIEDYRLELYGIIHAFAAEHYATHLSKVLEEMRGMKPMLRDYKWR
jgi:5'-deoxynucleotidase YfbR-like HD superfamily hydrolase